MKNSWFFFLICSALLLSSCGSSPEPADAKEAPMEISETMAPQIPEAAAETERFYGTAAYDGEAGETGETAGVNYFAFRQESTTYTDESDRMLLIQVLTRPLFYAADPQKEQWVNGVIDELYAADVQFGQDLLSYAREALARMGEGNFYSYSHHVSMEVSRHDDQVVSLLSLSSAYSGGANPNSVQTACNLDMEQLKTLSLEDVIYEEKAPELAALVQAGVENKFSALGQEILFEDYQQIVSNALQYGNMTPYWFFGENGLTIFFNQYELGPYAAGITRIELDYGQLESILRPEYIPQPRQGFTSGVSVSREPEEGDWVYYVDFGEGETAYISVEGTASSVQVSEVFYVEQTSVGQSMMFSANYLDDTTTIAITGDLTDHDRIYSVEYYDQQGGPNTVYVRGQDLLNELPESG